MISRTTNRIESRWSANSLFATTAQPERGTDRARARAAAFALASRRAVGRRRGGVGGRVRGGHATAPWAGAVRATARR